MFCEGRKTQEIDRSEKSFCDEFIFNLNEITYHLLAFDQELFGSNLKKPIAPVDEQSTFICAQAWVELFCDVILRWDCH